MKKWFILFVFAFFCLKAESAFSVEKPLAQKVTLQDAQKKNFKVVLTKYTNHNDELEVRIEAAGIPRFASKINPVLGFGRDTDGNGKIDSWFLITKQGIDLVRIEGNDPLGTDVLGNIFLQKYRTTFTMYASSAASSLLSYLFLSVSAGVDIQEEYYRDWMDLEEMRIQFEDDLANLGSAYTYTQIQFHHELISMGFKDLANRMDNFGKKTFWGYAFADIGLWITGGVVLNWGAKILARVGLIASESAFITAVKEIFVGFFEKQKAAIESRLSVLKDKVTIAKSKVGMKVAEKEVVTALTIMTYKKVLGATIKSYKMKQRLRIYIAKTMKWPKNIVKGAQSEWKYIVLNSSVQIGSEAFARFDEIYDPNPLVMAKNLATNPEVIQNVGFMATETVLMTGISKNMKTTQARFMASGAVAITNSSIVNFGLKEEANTSRVAFDTAWETIIGNAQVQIDLKALEYFEKMALKKNNPKLKLIGYAVALVDMGVGYVTYSKVTSALEKKEEVPSEPKVMLVPILAEH